MTNRGSGRPPMYWIYLCVIAGPGFFVMAFSCLRVLSEGVDYRWLVLTGLAGILAIHTLKIPGVNSKLSIADLFVLLSLILFGPAAGCLTAAFEAFCGSLRFTTNGRRLEYIVFNMGSVSLSAYVSGWLYPAVVPVLRLYGPLPAGLVLALSYHLLNSVTVAVMLAIETQIGAFRIWKDNFVWLLGNYLAGALGAVLLSGQDGGLTPLIVAAGTVVIIIFGSYKTILGRFTTCKAPDSSGPCNDSVSFR
jgi:hypothetical protein